MKRPALAACFLLMTLIAFAYLTGLPILPGARIERNVTRLVMQENAVTVTGTVKEVSVRDTFTVLLLSRTKMAGGSESVYLSTVEALVPDADGIKIGQILTVRGMPGLPSRASNPGQYDPVTSNRLMGVFCRLSHAEILAVQGRGSVFGEALRGFRRYLLHVLSEIFPTENVPVLSAMLLGSRDLLDDGIRSSYEAGGISHLLSVSSLHLSILHAAMLKLLKKLGMKEKKAGFFCMLGLLFYVIVTGARVPAIRALFIVGLSATAKYAGRTMDLVTALAWAAILLLIRNPYYLFDCSFQLSFAAVCLCAVAERRGKGLTLVILQTGMMPLTAWYFFKLPLLSFPVNLITVPFMPVILVSGTAALVLGCLGFVPGFTAAARAAGLPAVVVLRLYDAVLKIVRIPDGSFSLFGSVPVKNVLLTGRPSIGRIGIFCLLFLLFLYLLQRFRNRKKKLFCLLLLPVMIAVFVIRGPVRTTMTFLDVGQGDSICISTEEGFHCLIDGGSTTVNHVGRYRIVPYLEYEGIGHLDVIAATHMDEDHINGLTELFEMMAANETPVRADYLLVPVLPAEDEHFQAFVEAAEKASLTVIRVGSGDTFSFGTARMEVLNPVRKTGGNTEDTNEQCIVLAFHEGSFDALLTGDVTGEGEEQMIRQLEERGERYEVLKAAHHGSRFSTPERLLHAIRPEAAILSYGENNWYGHPHEETLARLWKAGTRVFRTAESGAITVTPGEGNFAIETFFENTAPAGKTDF